jgi:hypothetical protein
MAETANQPATQNARWLLLIHQLPAKPAYARVKIWRRLQGLGAVAIKNAVHALPASERSQEDFEWLLKEIVEAGGEAMLCEARLIDGLSDSDVQAFFNAARDQDYAEIAEEARVLLAALAQDTTEQARADVKAQFARLKKRHTQTTAADFFDANGRQAADGLVSALEPALAETAPQQIAQSAPADRLAGLKGRVWVTRIGVHVDRIACAWLIRRFVDADAAFKFVPPKGYVPEPGELRFDMFDAEFTHEGDRCSFEVLLERAGLDDGALSAIAEIVHDIDLKDEKFGREEASGIKTLIDGICASTRDDLDRIARGSTVFNDLYAIFSRKPDAKKKRAAARLTQSENS